MTQTISRIVLVGRDAPVWLAALALHKAFQGSIEVTALELPTLSLAAGVHSAVPAITLLHSAIGVDELALASACNAVPMVAQRYANWARTSPPFVHGYDVADATNPLLGLVQYWVKARGEGLRVDFDDFSLAAVAAKAGKVPTESSVLSGPLPPPGYQFDARSYAAAFKSLALRRGIHHRTGHLAGVKREGGQILSVEWEGGEEFTGDLFIDVSGVEALLIRSQPQDETVSWAEWLPCDRILNASAPLLSPLPSFSHNTAVRFGWIGLHPLRDRTAVVAAYSSKHAEPQDLNHLPAMAGIAISSDAVVTPLSPLGRPRAWNGNCVALGTAAVELEPLDAIELHIAHLGISQLIQWIQRDTDQVTAAAGFNEAVYGAAESLRDFLIAHYRLNRRFDEPFWDQARTATGPESLETKLRNFRARGSVGLLPDGAFEQMNWASILIGHGLIPESYEPWVDQVPEDELKHLLASRLREIADAVRAMPDVDQYVATAPSFQVTAF
jgi:tryptophan halogenase